MMDALKQRIIDFIKQNQPINDRQAICTFGIGKNRWREEKSKLKRMGEIYPVCGAGTFISKHDYDDWLENGGGKEKVRASQAKGGLVKGNNKDSKKLIIEYLPNIATPMTSGAISRACGVNEKTGHNIISALADMGLIEHDGAEYNRRYMPVMEGQPQVFVRRKADKQKSLCKRYDPRSNVVVRDYMASPARQRLLAVYGRMG